VELRDAMRVRVVLAVLASLLIAIMMSGGCTEPPLGWPYAGRDQPLPPPAGDAGGLVDSDSGPQNLPAFCAPAGVMCRKNHDCCSSVCNGLSTTGADAGVGSCLETDGGSPGGPYFIPPGVICSQSADCCFDPSFSMEGYCGPQGCGSTPTGTCVPTFIRCTETKDCCFPILDAGPEGGDSGGISMCLDTGGKMGSACNGAVEPGAAPLCVPYGIKCHHDSDCCVGKCSYNTQSPPDQVCDIPP
jgi:hypothetical protein